MSWRRMLEWSLIIDSWGFPINIDFQRSNASAAEEAVEETVITPLPMSETYSGIDAGFYDSPSGETITPFTEVGYGSGPSFVPPEPTPFRPRDYRTFFLPPGYPPQLLPGVGLIPHYLYLMDRLTEGTEYYYYQPV